MSYNLYHVDCSDLSSAEIDALLKRISAVAFMEPSPQNRNNTEFEFFLDSIQSEELLKGIDFPEQCRLRQIR
jgi:hypothetical protein